MPATSGPPVRSTFYIAALRFRCENTAMPPRDCGRTFFGPTGATHCPFCAHTAIPLADLPTTTAADARPER